MQYQSRSVDSDQTGIHQHLLKVLELHLHSDYKKPISNYSRCLFTKVESLNRHLNKPIILDAGCGTGASTQELALQNPEALVVGVDKSSHRLARGGTYENFKLSGNCLFLRMDLVDLWRLALIHEWKLQKHYLFYPNPWPKKKLLRKRWQAHPVFPCLLSLGGALELRSNWQTYAEEFQTAINYITPDSCSLEEYVVGTPISLFERKYSQSKHVIYRCFSELDNLVIDNQNVG